MKENCLAIITARGGSKRIPRKNVKNFLGKPIISYPIKATLGSGLFSEVMVSTDDEEIAQISRNFGAQTPFLRSAKNSDDHSTTADVVFEVLESYRALGKTFKYICCIYPTAAFLTEETLKKSFELLIKEKAKSVVPVVRFGFPIQRAVKIENNKMVMFQPEHMLSRSQDLVPSYHDCGQFYWLDYAAFMQDKKLYTDHTVAHVVDEMEVQDIDTLKDWEIAEFKFQLLNKVKLQ